MFSASTIVRRAAFAMIVPNALVVYLVEGQGDELWAGNAAEKEQSLPEHTIASFVHLPGPQNGHIARQSRFHDIGPAVEDSRLSRVARLQYGSLLRLPICRA